MQQDDQKPGPSSALLATTTTSNTHTSSQGSSTSNSPPIKTTTNTMRQSKQQQSSSKTLGNPKNPKIVITEMKQVSPSSSKATTPSSSSSFAITDSKKVVYSIFPPLHDTVLFGLTKRQLLTLVTLAITEFLSAQVYSIQSPFYPHMAVTKLQSNYTYSQIGSVFGIFDLAIFLCIPLFGKMMQNNGTSPKLLFHSGVFTAAISSIIFGFVEFIPDPLLFLIASLITRVVQGIGEAAILSSACALLTIEFQHSVATTFTSMETFYSLGLIFGPVIGGALMDIYGPHEAGQFALTFIVAGACLLFAAIAGLYLLPINDSPESFHELDGKCCFNTGGFKVFHLFKAPSIPLVALTILSAGSSVGFLNSMLEPHINEFLVGQSYVIFAAFFILSGGVCGIFAPGFNCLIEKIQRSARYFVVFGSILSICGFVLIGPSYFVPLEKSLLLTGIGLVVQGLGLAAITVGSFKVLLGEAIHDGYANNINSYGLVLTFWTLTFCFGSFIGSSVAGILYDIVGFSTATWFVIGLHLAVILFNMVSIVVNWRMRMVQKRFSVVEENREDEPLLTSDSFYNASTRKLRSYS